MFKAIFETVGVAIGRTVGITEDLSAGKISKGRIDGLVSGNTSVFTCVAPV